MKVWPIVILTILAVLLIAAVLFGLGFWYRAATEPKVLNTYLSACDEKSAYFDLGTCMGSEYEGNPGNAMYIDLTLSGPKVYKNDTYPAATSTQTITPHTK